MTKTPKIKPGQYYEDCDYHPVLCTESDNVDVAGISLLDGSSPRSCSIRHCGVRKLRLEQTIELREVWLIVMRRPVRDAFYGSHREQIMDFASEIHTSLSSLVRGSNSSLDSLILNASTWAESQNIRLNTFEIRAAVGLALLRLYTRDEINFETIEQLVQSHTTPVG